MSDDPTQIGAKVTGFVYIDTLNENDPIAIGDEVARLPYAYTIGK